MSEDLLKKIAGALITAMQIINTNERGGCTPSDSVLDLRGTVLRADLDKLRADVEECLNQIGSTFGLISRNLKALENPVPGLRVVLDSGEEWIWRGIWVNGEYPTVQIGSSLLSPLLRHAVERGATVKMPGEAE